MYLGSAAIVHLEVHHNDVACQEARLVSSHLIMDERQEWADNQGDAARDQGRQLVAQRFATACRCTTACFFSCVRHLLDLPASACRRHCI